MTEVKLHEVSDGILQTFVQWNDIEKAMQRAFNSKATFGPKKSAKDIGAGNGFLSRMCAIDADWQNNDNGAIPEKFALKICSLLSMVQYAEKLPENNGGKELFEGYIEQSGDYTREVHNAEVDTYALISKYASKGKVPMLQIYASKKTTEGDSTKGYIVMNLVEHAVPLYSWINADVDEIFKVVKATAVFHAITQKLTVEERSLYTETPMQDHVSKYFSEAQIEMSLRPVRNFNCKKLTERLERILSIFPQISDLARADRIPKYLGIPLVLCHGDLSSVNVLFSKKANQFEFAGICDFQIAHLGNPMEDIVRIISATLSAEQRREYRDRLIQMYYDTFEEEIDGAMPFTMDQLKLAYEMFYPLGGFMIAVVITIHASERLVGCMADQLDEEYRKEAISVLMDKACAILDDVFEYHEKYGSIEID